MPCDLTVFTDSRQLMDIDLEQIMIGSGRLYGKLRSSDSTILEELGIYNRDGFVFTPDYGSREIMSDQHRSTLRTYVHTVKLDFNIKLLMTSMENALYTFLSPNYSVDVSTGIVSQVCVTGDFAEPYWHFEFVVPYVWDANNWQREIFIPKAALKSVGDIVHKSEEEAVFDLTYSCNLDFDVSGYSSNGLLIGMRDVLETP